jgi:tetratricopeptide (TPR) repeat protein
MRFRFQCVVVFLAVLAAVGVGAWKARAGQVATETYSGIGVQASQQVFATMCALDAAGFSTDESTLEEMPGRLALRADLLKLQGPAAEALRQFYKDHALGSPSETLSHYMAFALVAGPPPDFQFPGDRAFLPPDVLTIDSFQELLANFYREARLDLRWPQIEREYAPAIARYQVLFGRIVTASNAYLREILKPATRRTFTVYVEPLVGNRTNFRNFGDQYSIVVGTSSQATVDAIQHAYLHFLLDPLVLRNRPAVDQKRALLQVAARAPRLPEEYHDDFFSLADECLIKAVELRLRHLSADRLAAALADADQSGFILVRPFVGQLQKFEKAEPAMSYYFPDLISGIDVQAEQKRLQSVTFASAEFPAASLEQGASERGTASELDRLLARGNLEIARKDAPAATAAFEAILEKYPDNPRALYGLAIASVLSHQADRAREIFEKLVSPPSAGETARPVDPSIVAWSHIYLGRMHDLEDDRDLAVQEYRAALDVEGAPQTARAAAQTGVETAYTPPSRPGENRQPKP